MSPEVQNRGIRGPTDRTDVLQKNKNAFQQDAYRSLQWPVAGAGGCLPREGVCLGGCLLRGGCLPDGCTPPFPLWTKFLTHACENITFLQLRLRTVKILFLFFSQIILMVADDMACNPRNPRPGLLPLTSRLGFIHTERKWILYLCVVAWCCISSEPISRRRCFHLRSVWMNPYNGFGYSEQQECIPVGCVPAAHWPYAGVCFPGGCLLQGGGGLGGVCSLGADGGCLLCGCLLPGGLVSQHALRQTAPPVNRMTDRCKNITLATTSLLPVKIMTAISKSLVTTSDLFCTFLL